MKAKIYFVAKNLQNASILLFTAILSQKKKKNIFHRAPHRPKGLFKQNHLQDLNQVNTQELQIF